MWPCRSCRRTAQRPPAHNRPPARTWVSGEHLRSDGLRGRWADLGYQTAGLTAALPVLPAGDCRTFCSPSGRTRLLLRHLDGAEPCKARHRTQDYLTPADQQIDNDAEALEKARHMRSPAVLSPTRIKRPRNAAGVPRLRACRAWSCHTVIPAPVISAINVTQKLSGQQHPQEAQLPCQLVCEPC